MAKNIMIQGTMSNVGKSFVVTGLCRFFKRKGYRVAPFKSQNMALNSFITKDGAEIGRAQAVQAEAAGIEPDYRMNPILLKPSSDKGSQIILNGKAIGEKSAKEYFLNKKIYIPYILEDYESLAKENDIIVIEGAGSPAEINLKKDDIVNMGLAKMIDAPVLLVGDINPGGVFAQLYGTMALLTEDERTLIKGLIINKFRGEKALLRSGLDEIERLTGRPVLGVLPYSDAKIEAEDSLVTDEKAGKISGKSQLHEKRIEIALISLPWASNFTDFEPFELEQDVSLRYVTKKEDLESPSCIMIPGTKNTMHDTRWLFETGLAERIIELHNEGVPVIGICGGYQILGQRLFDPHHIDGESDERDGLGLLPVETVFDEQKRTTNTEGKINTLPGFFENLSGVDIKGYEIHMGQSHTVKIHKPSGQEKNTEISDVADDKKGMPFIVDDVSASLGYVQNNVFGTYLHGLFENDEFRKAFLHLLTNKDNKETHFSYHDFREKQFDKAADLIEQNLDIEKVMNIIGL